MMLRNKVAAVYGGGPVSVGVTRAFAQEGACVFLAGRNTARLREIADDFARDDLNIEFATVDALNEREVDEFVDSIADNAGRIDISFNLIGYGDVQKPLKEISVDEFLQPIVTATRSHFLTIRAAARHMIPRRSGAILLFGGGGPQTMPGLGGFKVALDALESLRRQWAYELGEYGIRVVTLKTGGVPETIAPDFAAREVIEESITQASLLKRAASLQDVGDVAAFVASDRARMITATDINISGGSIVD